MYYSNITIGADPELFIYNKKSKKFVSSIGLIPGVKKAAYTEGLPKGFGLQIDNVLAEYNIPPVQTKDAFIQANLYMIDYITKHVQKTNLNYTVMTAASAQYPKSELTTPEAKLFGCDPDYNVYTKAYNPAPKAQDPTLRSAGFHVHIGYDSPTIEDSLTLVKALDKCVGLPSVIIDKDTKRRALYGKAGSFRLTSYGVEYRVLSGAFLKDEAHLSWLWDAVAKAIEEARNMKEGDPIVRIEESKVIDTINSGNTKVAKRLCDLYNINYSL